VPLDEPSVRSYLLGRPAYRRTRYLVARHGTASAVLEVSKESEQPLFSPITAVALVAAAEETAFVDAPEADTTIPSQLARVAAERAPQARCVIVRGRYGHVSFIADPAPVRVTVVEVVPPRPAKLVDQLTRVLDLAEDLPPVELVPDLVDLAVVPDRVAAPAKRLAGLLATAKDAISKGGSAEDALGHWAPGVGARAPPGNRARRGPGGRLLPRRGAQAQAVDPGRVRPVPRHP
jgi:hypothetical protein